jgi:hypothetical protein
MKLKRVLIAVILLFFSTVIVYAYTNTQEDFDNSLVQGIEYSYQEPTKILFTQIEGRYDSLALNPEEFLDTVYYYSITKLKLGNMPFHYAVDESGNIYKTATYDALKITNDKYIVVGYLSNNGQLTNGAASSIVELTEDISYRYGIEEYDIYSYGLIETENSFSELTLIDPNDLFVNSVDSTLEDWEGYEMEHLEYIATVENIEYEDTVTVGEDLAIKVTIQNNNDFLWSSDKNPIYVSVKDLEDSIFAVNEVWDSFSRPTHIDSDTYVLPGETVEILFDLDPKVAPGEYSETFNLLKFDEQPFSGSEFTIEFNVEKGEQELVRITSPEAGYVNIRNCRRFSCEQVDVVNDGEVYPVVEYHESCWYKIAYGEDKEGWFYCPYAEEL